MKDFLKWCSTAIVNEWRTTGAGMAAAFFAFVLFKPIYFPSWLVDISAYAAIGGLAVLGIAAKDVMKKQ